MATYRRVFAAPGIVEIEREIGRQVIACERVNAKAIKHGLAPPFVEKIIVLGQVAKNNRRKLNEVAAKTAVLADDRIKTRLRATAKRGPTGFAPHLEDLIVSRALIPNTGSVGIADEKELDKARNRHSGKKYGPYWRAQEFGTGTPEVPSQRKRPNAPRGFFYGAGGEGAGASPSPSQFRAHPVFIVGGGPQGGKGAPLIIDREIEGRHFLRDGANLAAQSWRRDMARVDKSGAAQIAATSRSVTSTGRRALTQPLRRRGRLR